MFIVGFDLSEKTAFDFSSVRAFEVLLFIESELEGILFNEEFGDDVFLPGERETDSCSL